MLQTCRSQVKFRGMAVSTLRQRSVMANCMFSINSLGFAIQDAATSAVSQILVSERRGRWDKDGSWRWDGSSPPQSYGGVEWLSRLSASPVPYSYLSLTSCEPSRGAKRDSLPGPFIKTFSQGRRVKIQTLSLAFLVAFIISLSS
jgi:hypothetical protein